MLLDRARREDPQPAHRARELCRELLDEQRLLWVQRGAPVVPAELEVRAP
ncbi:MAG TPA: hypothetical protein VLC54_00310 [Anaeromyxobacter sp.]|nr:hypothetical protein [Anaeromyxobacter sp.]